MIQIDYIIQYLNDASDFFYDIYLEVLGWVWPFWHAAEFFYDLCLVFNKLAWRFYYFGQWVDDIADQVEDILSWSTIRSYIRSWLPNLESAISWWSDWWYYVKREVDSWWNSTKLTVQSWIDTAKQFLQSQIDSLSISLSALLVAWNDFKGKIPSITEILAWWSNWWSAILAQIITWGALTANQINSLIESSLKSWLPFYESLAQLWSSVAEFITDPLEWLWDRFTDWFLGKE